MILLTSDALQILATRLYRASLDRSVSMSQPATVSLVENGIFPDNKRYRYSDSIHLRDPGVVDEPLKQQKVSQFQTISDDSGSDKSTEREPEAGYESSAGPSYSPLKMEPTMEKLSQNNPSTHPTEMPHAMEAPHEVEASHAVETPRAVEAPHTVEAPQAVEVLRPTGDGPSTQEMSGNPPSEASQLSTAPEAPSSPHLRAVEEHSSQSKTTTRSFRELFRRTANHIRERSSHDISRPPSRLSYRKGRPSTSTRHVEDFTLSEVNEPTERQQRKSLSGVNENSSMLSRSSGNSHTSLTFGNLRKLMKVSTGASLLGKSKSGLHSNQDEPLFQIKFPTLNNLKDQLRFSNFGSPTRFGAEPKAKQPMTSDLDYIEVDTLDLTDTFVSASKGLGRKGREIAKGSTASVKVMYRKGTVSVIPYAVKEFRKPKSNVDGHAFATQIKSEFSIANSLHHPNIVETICLCTHAGRWNHVMEYCGQGELFSLVQKDYFKMDDKFCLFKQMLQGVAYLHSNGIAHRDIKLENLLLTDHGHLKITDFGVAVVFRGPHPGLRAVYNETEEHDEIRKCEPGICGSLPYIAPEVLRRDCKFWLKFSREHFMLTIFRRI